MIPDVPLLTNIQSNEDPTIAKKKQVWFKGLTDLWELQTHGLRNALPGTVFYMSDPLRRNRPYKDEAGNKVWVCTSGASEYCEDCYGVDAVPVRVRI